MIPYSRRFSTHGTCTPGVCPTNLQPSHLELCLAMTGGFWPIWTSQPAWCEVTRSKTAGSNFASKVLIRLNHGKAEVPGGWVWWLPSEVKLTYCKT